MLNSTLSVLKKPIAIMRPSCLVTSFPTLVRSSSVFVCQPKRGIRSSASLSHPPLRVASPKATHTSVNKITTPSPTTARRQLKEVNELKKLQELSDSLSSESDDDDDDEDSDDDYAERGHDVVRKLMKYVSQLVEELHVKSPRMVEEDSDDEPSVIVVGQYMKDDMDQLMQKGSGHEKSRNYVKEDDGVMYIRFEMPGLSKDEVKVTVDKNMLVIKGEEKKAAGDDDEKGMKYNGSVKLKTKVYKIDQIKAEMKNGVLMVVVPKFKDEERKDLIHVKVD
ncbi:hypothetical protein AQUCO_03800096v1 [Aquilegia coerulea]|uniref:SHSP domain-containing protein n=1 Tax=Aquilegia coerulea TaxID=218851 RepID=A0A2G5CSU0_AQUCA|nr:hypothetical protein AQUCO_03800096v1 [Aquilegia coerulea]